MSAQLRTFAVMLIVTIFAAGTAGWLGVSYGMKRSQPDLDTQLHERLNLSSAQAQQIEGLESRMTSNRERLRARMRTANKELADAINHDHAYGSAEKLAVEHFHQAMIELQEDTIVHVLAMRAVLKPDQARTFDELVQKSLTDTNS